MEPYFFEDGTQFNEAKPGPAPMNVKELREALIDVDDNLPVTIGTPHGDYGCVFDVGVKPADEGQAFYIQADNTFDPLAK